jgi:hypothetical protein
MNKVLSPLKRPSIAPISTRQPSVEAISAIDKKAEALKMTSGEFNVKLPA